MEEAAGNAGKIGRRRLRRHTERERGGVGGRGVCQVLVVEPAVGSGGRGGGGGGSRRANKKVDEKYTSPGKGQKREAGSASSAIHLVPYACATKCAQFACSG